jgi:hypothetical protein
MAAESGNVTHANKGPEARRAQLTGPNAASPANPNPAVPTQPNAAAPAGQDPVASTQPNTASPSWLNAVFVHKPNAASPLGASAVSQTGVPEEGAERKADAEFKDIDAIVRRALSEVRQAVTNYRQPTLAAELSSAVQATAAAGIDCEVRSPGSWDLPVPVDGLLAWTVREGITNVLRHSGASSCLITLSLDPLVSIDISKGWL